MIRLGPLFFRVFTGVLVSSTALSSTVREIPRPEALAAPYRSVGRLTLADSAQCTASLVHDRWLLTAAHCFVQIDSGDFRHQGSFQFSDEVGTSAFHRLRQVWVPDRSGGTHRSLDFALVELVLPVLGRSLDLGSPQGFDVSACAAGYPAEGFDFTNLGSALIESCGHLGSPLRGSEQFQIADMDVHRGHSGSPLLWRKEGGQFAVAGVVAARMFSSSGGEERAASGPLMMGVNLDRVLAQVTTPSNRPLPSPSPQSTTRPIDPPRLSRRVSLGSIQASDLVRSFMVTLEPPRRKSPPHTTVSIELICEGRRQPKRFRFEWDESQRRKISQAESIQLVFASGERPSDCQLQIERVEAVRGTDSSDLSAALRR